MNVLVRNQPIVVRYVLRAVSEPDQIIAPGTKEPDERALQVNLGVSQWVFSDNLPLLTSIAQEVGVMGVKRGAIFERTRMSFFCLG
jgi:hypothetical protein